MKFEAITQCRICGNSDLIPIIDLGEHALTGRFPATHESDPPAAPMALVKCNDKNNANKCGLLQLKHNMDAEELYFHDYGYRSGLNKTMTDHLHGIVKEIEARVNFKEGDIAIDIGSNDATMLKAYSAPVRRVGIDPTGKQFQRFYTDNITLVPDFFNRSNVEKAIPGKKAKVITSIAMFYDLPDPLAFARDVKASLDKDGIWVFEQSYMPTMLTTNSFDTICHEHLEYYALKQIQWIMRQTGMKIIDVSFNDINGGSFRTTVAHADSSFVPANEKISKILEEEREQGLDTLQPYEAFKERVEDVRNQLISFLQTEKKKGKSIYLYGASTKGNTLLQYFGLGPEIFTAAAERNTEKYGRRTPKTNIPIISEAEARAAKPDYFLVLPWHFKSEFLEREKAFLEEGGKFIFPLPTFEVIGKN